MKENEVIEIIEKELATKVDLDTEGQWDSLDHVTVLQALDTAYEEKLKDIRELETATTPRKIINILKTHGLVE